MMAMFYLVQHPDAWAVVKRKRFLRLFLKSGFWKVFLCQVLLGNLVDFGVTLLLVVGV